jgi:hypothetical protein
MFEEEAFNDGRSIFATTRNPSVITTQ